MKKLFGALAGLLLSSVVHAGGLIASVPHGEDDVILRIKLIDEDGTQCPSSDITSSESGSITPSRVWRQ